MRRPATPATAAVAALVSPRVPSNMRGLLLVVSRLSSVRDSHACSFSSSGRPRWPASKTKSGLVERLPIQDVDVLADPEMSPTGDRTCPSCGCSLRKVYPPIVRALRACPGELMPEASFLVG